MACDCAARGCRDQSSATGSTAPETAAGGVETGMHGALAAAAWTLAASLICHLTISPTQNGTQTRRSKAKYGPHWPTRIAGPLTPSPLALGATQPEARLGSHGHGARLDCARRLDEEPGQPGLRCFLSRSASGGSGGPRRHEPAIQRSEAPSFAGFSESGTESPSGRSGTAARLLHWRDCASRVITLG